MVTTYLTRALEAVVALAVVAVLLGAVLGQPMGVGYVETGSMDPTLAAGDGFVAVPAGLVGAVGEGDVVTFRPERLNGGRLTTHRIVGQTDEGYITRGDANAFTDQQAGEPPVTREQVTTVALSVDGTVVAIPALGTVVLAVQQALGAVGGFVGVGDPTTLAVALVAALLVALTLDELLAPSRTDRTRSQRARPPSRDTGYDAGRLLVGGVAVVLVVATASMVVPSGTATVTYDSVAPGDRPAGGIPAGETGSVPMHLANAGVAPTVTFLDAPDGARLSTDAVTLGPRERATVNATVTAPSEPGRYEQPVHSHRYVHVLPVGVLRVLHGVGPWLAVVVVDAVVGVVLLGVGRVALGRGRLRLRPTRPRPGGGPVRSAVRRLYR